MSYGFYKIWHVLGIASLLLGFGWLLLSAHLQKWKELKRPGLILHGVGLISILISGFGLAARLEMFRNLPPWIHLKITVWVILGIMVILIKRFHKITWVSLSLIMGLIYLAAFTAVTKPF